MKRHLLLAALIAATICSCGGNGTDKNSDSSSDGNLITKNSEAKHYEFDLTVENYWKFINVEITKGTTSYYTVACTFNGVLSFAYYEDVKFVASYKIQGTSANYEAKITKELNAGGNGSIVLPYDYVPENITPSFNGSNLYGYERSLTIESVSGKVLFSA